MSRPIVVIVCMDAPPNRESFNSAHIFGTHVPVEEPSTASTADSCTATNAYTAAMIYSIPSSAWQLFSRYRLYPSGTGSCDSYNSQLPSKLMVQRKFGTRRRAMLSFERQPFPAPCHVDQDVAHSQAWRALGHLTTFNRVLSALHRRNHLPLPPDLFTQPMLPWATRCSQHRWRPLVHFGTNSDPCATPCALC